MSDEWSVVTATSIDAVQRESWTIVTRHFGVEVWTREGKGNRPFDKSGRSIRLKTEEKWHLGVGCLRAAKASVVPVGFQQLV